VHKSKTQRSLRTGEFRGMGWAQPILRQSQNPGIALELLAR
jgi:hypothetical protein